jgi:meso-butanediol dehydrogenase / (S,S)-butanediol dehydrogenase / diacetyl reductase
MPRLENTVVMITGGAQGIGEGIARRLASEGAAIAIADLNGDKAKAVAETLKGEGAAGAIGVQVDVGDRGQVQAAIKAIVDSFGRLDVLFNNAGFNKPLPFLEVDEANFNSIMRVNAWGVMLGIQEGAKQMIAQGGGGKIINTASIAGRQGYAEFAPYCCSKSAVISLTQAGAREFAKHRITVNAFAPGVVVTPLWDGLEQDTGHCRARRSSTCRTNPELDRPLALRLRDIMPDGLLAVKGYMRKNQIGRNENQMTFRVTDLDISTA